MVDLKAHYTKDYGEDFVNYLYTEVSSRSDKKYKIVEALLQGKTFKEVAEEFDLSNSYVVSTCDSVVRYFCHIYFADEDDIVRLELSTRTYHSLCKAGIRDITKLKEFLERGMLDDKRGIGKASIVEIKQKLGIT